jgi:polyferredoxin
VATPRRPPARFDFAPWLAGLVVVLLVGVSLFRKVALWAGWEIPGGVNVFLGDFAWWAYWAGVVVLGVMVIRRWRNTYFRWRTVSVMVSQTLFGILLTGPLKQELGVPVFWQRLHLTWPLHMSVITPYWQEKLLSTFLYGAAISLIAWPVVAAFIGMRYCSWFCFCGNLAETTGDPFRVKGPKGPSAQRLDTIGYVVLGAAALVTATAWLGMSRPWTVYDIVVAWFLASFVGTAAYPVLGSRVWCRFLCPLRAMLGWFSARGRFAIYTDGQRCIECGTCNRYCEMGIDIRQRARQGVPLRDTECVGCGACIAVCPRYALSFYSFPSAEDAMGARNARRFSKPFSRQLATPRGG